MSCLLLNQTTRKQVDKVIDELFHSYPGPASMATAKDEDLYSIIRSLGMAERRTATLKRFSHEYMTKQWKSPKELYGCGKYAEDTWLIFCEGKWAQVEPSDHALNNYHSYLSSVRGNIHA